MTARDEAQRPEDFWKLVDNEFHFNLDIAASPYSRKTASWIGPGSPIHTDALSSDFMNYMSGLNESYRIWCNPPYSKIRPWAEICRAHARLNGGTACLLTPASRAQWFEDVIDDAHEVRHLTPRVQFLPPPGVNYTSNDRDSMLIVFRPIPVNWPGARMWLWRWRRV